MQPEDISRARDGARLAHVLPYLEDELDKLDNTVKTKIFALISENKLDPDAAFGAWMELFATYRLRHKLRTLVRIGVEVGKRVPGLKSP